jgi:hypothetical protein
MNKLRGYRYSLLPPYYSFQRIVTILLPVCFITFVICSTIVYLNFHYILDLFGFGPHTHIEGTRLKISSRKRGLSIYDRKIVYKDFNYLNASTLTYTKRKYPSNVEILFRFPNNVPTKALLLIFHGCGRTAPDWFHTVERQRIVGAAIDLGYGCLVFETVNQFTHCWTSFTEMYENDDINQVWKGLEAFYKEYPHLGKLK